MISGMRLAQRICSFRQSRIVISLTRCFTYGLANSYQTADRLSKQIAVSQSVSGATPVTAGSDSLAIYLGSIGWREKDLGTRNSIPRPLHCLLLCEDTGRYGKKQDTGQYHVTCMNQGQTISTSVNYLFHRKWAKISGHQFSDTKNRSQKFRA